MPDFDFNSFPEAPAPDATPAPAAAPTARRGQPDPAWLSYIDKKGENDPNGVRPALVKGLIQTESAWDPAAEYHGPANSHAVGLGQFQPGTADELGIADRRDPYQNIDGIYKYMGSLLHQHGGDEDAALRAYGEPTDEYVSKVQTRAAAWESSAPPAQAADAGTATRGAAFDFNKFPEMSAPPPDDNSAFNSWRVGQLRIDPAKAEASWAIAQQRQLDPTWVSQNFDAMKQSQDTDERSAILAAHPALAKIFNDPVTGSIVKDSLPQVASLDSLVSGRSAITHNPFVPDWLDNIGKAIVKGADPEQPYLAAKAMLGRASDEDYARLNQLEQEPSDFGATNDFERAVYGAAGAVPFMGELALLGLGASALGAPLAAASIIGGVGAGGITFLQSVGPTYRRLRAAGADDESAFNWAVGSSVVGGVIMGAAAPGAFGIKSLIGTGAKDATESVLTDLTRRGAAWTFAKGLGGHWLTGTGMMTAQAAAESVAEQMAKPGEFDGHRVLEDTKTAAWNAATSMALLAPWGPAADYARDRGRIARTVEDSARIGQLVDAVKTSKVSDPQIERVISELRQSGVNINPGDDASTIYVDRQAFDRAAAQNEVEPRILASRVLGDGGVAYDTAVHSGSSLPIPIEKYAANMVRSGFHDQLRADVKFTPDGWTQNEALARKGEFDAYVAKSAPLAAEVASVRERELHKALGAGVSIQQAEAHADLMQAIVVRHAIRTGLSPEAAYTALGADRLAIVGKGGLREPLANIETPLPAPGEPRGPLVETLAERQARPEAKARKNPYMPPLVEDWKQHTDTDENAQTVETRPLTQEQVGGPLADASKAMAGPKGDLGLGPDESKAALEKIQKEVGPIGGETKPTISETKPLAGETAESKVEKITPALETVARANPALDETDRVNNALKLINEARASGKTIDQIVRDRQAANFGERESAPETQSMAHMLEGRTAADLGSTFDAWAKYASGEGADLDRARAMLRHQSIDLDGSTQRLFQPSHLRLARPGEELSPEAIKNSPARALDAMIDGRLKPEDLSDEQLLGALAHNDPEGEWRDIIAARAYPAEIERLMKRTSDFSWPLHFDTPEHLIEQADDPNAPENVRKMAKEVADKTAMLEEFPMPSREEMIEPLKQQLEDARPMQTLAQPAYHGTPHDVDQFKMEKIGTGEGAQVYGHGLYFAENKEIADWYRKKLSNTDISFSDKIDAGTQDKWAEELNSLRDRIEVARGDVSVGLLDWKQRARAQVAKAEQYLAKTEAKFKAIPNDPQAIREIGYDREALDRVKAYSAFAETIDASDIKAHGGRLYQVDVPESDRLLDWDKPLSEQSGQVKKAIDSLGLHVEKDGDGGYGWHIHDGDGSEGPEYTKFSKQTFYSKDSADKFLTGMTGEELYKMYSARNGAQAASGQLKTAGLPGLMYFDAGSRGKAAGEHNFVIWDENEIRNLQRLKQDGVTPEQSAQIERGSLSIIHGANGKEYRIHLGPGADASTLAHETMHWLVDTLSDVVSKPGADPELVRDHAALLKWAGYGEGKLSRADAYAVGDKIRFTTEDAFANGMQGKTTSRDAEVTTVKKNPMTGEAAYDVSLADGRSLTVAHSDVTGKYGEGARDSKNLNVPAEEKIASAWEQYLAEGKAPTIALDSVFGRFSKWMAKIYSGVQGIAQTYSRTNGGSDLGMNDEIRGIFDRMLATSDDIEQDKASRAESAGGDGGAGAPPGGGDAGGGDGAQPPGGGDGGNGGPPREPPRRKPVSEQSLRWAMGVLAKQPISQISDKFYLDAERKNSRRAIDLAAEGKHDESRNADVTRSFAAALHDAAKIIIKSTQAQLGKLRALNSQDALGKVAKSAAEGMGHEYLDTMQSLLEGAGLRQPGPDAAQRQTDVPALLARLDFDGRDPNFDPDQLRKFLEKPKPWNTLTPEEAANLTDAAMQIKTAANGASKVILGTRRAERRATIDAMSEFAAKRPDLGLEPITRSADEGLVRGVLKYVGLYNADNLKPEAIWAKFGPEGRALFEATLGGRNEVAKMKGEVLRHFIEKFQPLLDGGRFQKMLRAPLSAETLADLKTDGNVMLDPTKMNVETLFMAFLNMGTTGPTGSDARLLGGYKWNEGKLLAAIGREVPKELLDFGQGILDYSEKHIKHLIWEHAERLNGVAPPELQRRKILIRHADGTATNYDGGYFAAKYNSDASSFARQRVGTDSADGSLDQTARATVASSFTKARVNGYKDVVDLNWSNYPNHLNSVFHYLGYDDPVRSLASVLRDRAFREMATRRIGTAQLKQLDDSVKTIASGQSAAAANMNIVSKLLSGAMRSRPISNAIGFSFGIAAQQIPSHTEYAVLSGKISAKNGNLALGRVWSSENWQQHSDLSRQYGTNGGELAYRADHYASLFREALSGQPDVLGGWKRKADTAAFGMMDYADRTLSHVIWDASFRDALEGRPLADGSIAGNEAAAVEHAERTVRDLMPVHNRLEMAKIVRDPGVLGALQLFRGLKNVVWNTEADLIDKARVANVGSPLVGAVGRYGVRAGQIAASAAVLHLLGKLWGGHGKNDDDGEGLEGWATWAERNAMASLFSLNAPFGGEIAEGIADHLAHGETVAQSLKAGAKELRLSPGTAMIADSAKRLGVMVDSDAETPERVGAATQLLLSNLGGYSQQVGKTGGYVSGLASGNEQPRGGLAGALDVASGITYGSPGEKNTKTIPTLIGDVISGHE